jgi:glycosyltransferase involved in cell wall biosynthesis
MAKPIFSVITTAKNEKNKEILNETFSSWETAKDLFGKSVEFVVADGGGNAEFSPINSMKIISSEEYERERKKLYESGIIKHRQWDTPSIGRNIGFKYARGKIVVFQDADSLFSTGTHMDYKYVNEMDEYDNWFKVIYDAFKRKCIVATASSLRPRDSKKVSRRFGAVGLNTLTWFSLKFPTVERMEPPIIGASIPGCSIAVLREVALRICYNGFGPYDPELAVGEDYKLSRLVGMFGKISYEKRAGIFVRTLNRISSGFDIAKCIFYGIKLAPHFFFPGFSKYQRHESFI